MPADAAELDRREEQRTIPRRVRSKRRPARYLLIFVACVIVGDALIGERGLVGILRANRQYAELASSIAELRRENAGLREQARRLRQDPRTIEEFARSELGMIRPGERLFIITESPSPQSTSASSDDR